MSYARYLPPPDNGGLGEWRRRTYAWMFLETQRVLNDAGVPLGDAAGAYSQAFRVQLYLNELNELRGRKNELQPKTGKARRTARRQRTRTD